MQDVVQDDTKLTLTSRTLIDLTVTTRKDLVSTTDVFPLGILYHNLIYAALSLKNKRPPPKDIKTRLDEDKFRYDIQTAPFYISSVFDDEDDVFWAWKHLFNNICDEHAALKEVRIRSRSTPWITNTIRCKMNQRYKLFKTTVSSKCSKMW